VEAITGARSVDFVTTAGAGGKVLQLFESARESLPDEDDGTDTSDAEGVKGMDIKEAEARIAELDTAIKERDTAISESENHIAKLESEVARYREAEILTETRTLVAAQVAKSTLPELTQARLVESLSKNPPLTEDVTLDKDALAESTESAIKEEAEYLAKLTESGKVKGMGGSEHTEDEDGAKSGAKLEGAFKEMGLSDSEAKLAAQGR
jgi:hypothetical protein